MCFSKVGAFVRLVSDPKVGHLNSVLEYDQLLNSKYLILKGWHGGCVKFGID